MDSWSAESLVCIKCQGYKKKSIAKNHVVTVWFFPPLLLLFVEAPSMQNFKDEPQDLSEGNGVGKFC